MIRNHDYWIILIMIMIISDHDFRWFVWYYYVGAIEVRLGERGGTWFGPVIYSLQQRGGLVHNHLLLLNRIETEYAWKKLIVIGNDHYHVGQDLVAQWCRWNCAMPVRTHLWTNHHWSFAYLRSLLSWCTWWRIMMVVRVVTGWGKWRSW